MCEKQHHTGHLETGRRGGGGSIEDNALHTGKSCDGHLYFTLLKRHGRMPQRHGDKYSKTQNIII
jgi:hypothetical protein